MTVRFERGDDGPLAAGIVHQLAPTPTSARLARLLVAQTLQETSSATAYAAEVLVSELVTNAVMHAEGPIELEITYAAAGSVCISVSDCAVQAPRLSLAGQDAMIGGQGLRIVEALASAWGWEPVTGGKRVWCELRPERDSRAGDASPTS